MNKKERILEVLDRLGLDTNGQYENGFYIIKLKDSDEYAYMYSKLDNNAINTEYPSFGQNTNKTVTKVTTYFEVTENNITYNLFLIANFDTEEYYLKIGEKE